MTLPEIAPEARAAHERLLALRDLQRTNTIEAAELAYQVDREHWWEGLCAEDGHRYHDPEDYFTDVLDCRSFRSAARRIAVGKALHYVDARSRPYLRQALIKLGITRSGVIAPAIVLAPNLWTEWVNTAARMPIDDLQAKVSSSLGTDRTKPSYQPGGHAYHLMLNWMPSLADRELFERWLQVGKRVTGSETVVGVLIHSMQECLSSWEPLGAGMPDLNLDLLER